MLEEYKRSMIAGEYWSDFDDLDPLSVADVSRIILEVLQSSLSSSDPRAFGTSSDLFLQLVLLRAEPTNNIGPLFAASYRAGEQRAIVEQLELALEHPLFNIRRNTICTLGRIGSRESVEKMVEAFDRAIEGDLGILTQLVKEIGWITQCEPELNSFDGVYRGLLERLAHSDSYLNRWAAVEIIQSWPICDQSDLVEQLKLDAHPLVRLQAESPDEAVEQRVDYWSLICDHHSPTGYSANIEEFVAKWIAENAS